MVPAWILKSLTKANDFIKDKKGLLSEGADKLSDDKQPDIEDSEQPQELKDGPGGSKRLVDAPQAPVKAPRPIKGAGADTFRDLAPSVLQFWLDTIKAMNPDRPETHTETTVDLSGHKQISDVSVESTPGIDISVSEEVNAATAEAADKENGDWDFLWLVLLGVISYYGAKLIWKNGKWVITTAADGILRALNDFTDMDKSTLMEIENLNLHEADGGIGRLLLGTDKYRISTQYGAVDSLHPDPHAGVDYAAAKGTAVRTALSGIVTFVNTGSKTAGNYVEVASESGYVQRFLHLDEIKVQQGQRIAIGDTIGTVGSTGQSTGPHLHYEVYKGTAAPGVGTTVHKNDAYTRTDPRNLAEYLQTNAAYEGLIKPSDRPDFYMTTAVPAGQNMVLPKTLTATARGFNYMSVTTTGQNPWRGETGSTKNSAVTLATFSSPEFGWRAGMMNILNYQVKHDVSNSGGQYVTIADIATNDKNHSYVSTKNGDIPTQWAANVAKGSGFKVTDRLDLRDPETLARVSAGVGLAEHSVKTSTGYLQTIIRSFDITHGPTSNKQ